jgi:type IV pilus assembly protein PilN
MRQIFKLDGVKNPSSALARALARALSRAKALFIKEPHTDVPKEKVYGHNSLFFFNLIPYREGLIKKQKNMAITTLVMTLLAALLLGYYLDSYVAGLARIQQDNLSYLKSVDASLLKKVKNIVNLRKERAKIETKDHLIGVLQDKRSASVSIFNSLLKDTPSDVFLTKFKLNGRLAGISGYASGNNKVALYMQNIEKSKTFTNPVLLVVSKTSLMHNSAVSFKLQVSLKDITTDTQKTKMGIK